MRWKQIVGGGVSWWYLIDANGKILDAKHERDLFAEASNDDQRFEA
jgi:hypothetical protein